MPSAPYSMVDRDHAVFTQTNNVVNTLNVIYAIRDLAPGCHLVKLGTMGEYGTPNIDIEEGFIEIDHKGRRDVLPFPKLPGSMYHLSKVHDSHNIHFACRVWDLAATDLNQGVVYGIQTEETAMDDRLLTRFDYDDVFGTALNRFCLQAVVGFPLTVYGGGGQTRGYLNIEDTLALRRARGAPPRGARASSASSTSSPSCSRSGTWPSSSRRRAPTSGWTSTSAPIENPRVELEQHHYDPVHTKLLDLGLEPRLLSDTLIESMFATIERFRDRADDAPHPAPRALATRRMSRSMTRHPAARDPRRRSGSSCWRSARTGGGGSAGSA